MKAIFFLLMPIFVGVLLSMTLAIYLPLEKVNKMFITGLGAPIIISIIGVWAIRANSLKRSGFIMGVSVPILSFAVYIGLVV